MGYVIATRINNVNYCVRADQESNSFQLVPVRFDSDISKAFCHPNKTGALNVLAWITEHDKALASKGLSVQPEARYIH